VPRRRPAENLLAVALFTNRSAQEVIMTQSNNAPLLCPSIISIGPEAQVFGVLTGSPAEGFQVGYLTEAVPATPELLAAAAPADPAEVFRAAAPCFEYRGKHFGGAKC